MNASFQKLINGERPVLIDFHATWCGPCKMMNPIIKELAGSWKKRVRIIKIDIDKNKELATQLKVMGVPTFMLYKNGERIWRQSGMLTISAFEEVLEEQLGEATTS